MKRINYYSLLGINQNADKDQIKSAFRRLAKKYHPDKIEPGKNSESAFIIIHNAYKILIDDKTRNEYDTYLAKAKNYNTAEFHSNKNLNPVISKTLSEFNYILWDIADILKKINEEDLKNKVDETLLYDHILFFFKYLEEELLKENYRFVSFINKKNKIKLHVDNYFYLLRVEIDNYIVSLEFGIKDKTNELIHLMHVKNKIIEFISDIYRMNII